MSGVRTTQTQAILALLMRNGQGAFTANRTPTDAWNAYLTSVIGGSGKTVGTKSLEQEWLKLRISQLGGTPPTAGTLSDLWRVFLQIKGHSGDMVDMFNQWLDHGTV